MKTIITFKNLDIEFSASESYLSPEDGLYGSGMASQYVTVEVVLDRDGVPLWDMARIELEGMVCVFYQDQDGADHEKVIDLNETDEKEIKEKALSLAINEYYKIKDVNTYYLTEEDAG